MNIFRAVKINMLILQLLFFFQFYTLKIFYGINAAYIFSWHPLSCITVDYMYTLSSMIRRKLKENLIWYWHAVCEALCEHRHPTRAHTEKAASD